MVDGLFGALCAGTFLYLSLCHLIPESLNLFATDHCHGDSHGSLGAVSDLPLEEGPLAVQTPATKNDLLADPSQLKSARSSLLRRFLVLSAIGLGWTTFALFALAP